MKSNKTKIILLLLAGAMIPVLIIGTGYIYLKTSLKGFEWSDETRVMLYEEYSPDKKHKLGVYNYDSGALGYSSVQASIVESQQEYPISGNILPHQYVNSVKWMSNERAELTIWQENKFHSNVLVNLK